MVDGLTLAFTNNGMRSLRANFGGYDPPQRQQPIATPESRARSGNTARTRRSFRAAAAYGRR